MSWQRADATCTHVCIEELEAARRAATLHLLGLKSVGDRSQRFSVMTLEVEVAVLRGFLTASEENTWRQSIDSTAGEQRGVTQPPGAWRRERGREREGFLKDVYTSHGQAKVQLPSI